MTVAGTVNAVPAGLPTDAVLLGHISGAFGIKGWIKVHPYSGQADALLHTQQWWLHWAQRAATVPVAHTIVQSKLHSGAVVAQLQAVPDRNGAEALRGAEIWVPRSAFPAADDDEYYLVDLLGMQVVNQQEVALGEVIDVFDNGAHDVLVIEAKGEVGAAENAKPKQRMLPFVDAYVLEVDEAQRVIQVDWLPEWDDA